MRNTAIALGILVVLFVVFGFFMKERDIAKINRGEIAVPGVFKSDELGLNFTYNSDEYVLVEGANEYGDQIASYNLFEKGEYEDFVNSETPREGPAGISVQIFRNSGADNQKWVNTHGASNITLSTTGMQFGTVDDKDAVRYTWSGLYDGRTVVVTTPFRVYMFTVTYTGLGDNQLLEMDAILHSVRIAKS